MPRLPGVTPTNQKVWINRHSTFTQKLDNIFDITNGNSGDIVRDYNATTSAIQLLIAKAIARQTTIRALGGGWSFSKVAATNGWLLNTKLLNFIFEISNTAVSVQYPGDKQQLVFAQCGNSVQELNDYLKSVNKSLRCCGASNGQTIVGAFSTGTHGSAIDMGSTPDFIVGMHIITGPETSILLERASYPVASDSLVQRLETVLVRNDELFNAALVSFGSAGFIHGVMIETEPLYLLECYRQRVRFDGSLKRIMQTLDFGDAVMLPHGTERPFHFQVVINQFDLSDGAYITVMYKRPYTEKYDPPVADLDKAGPGDDIPAFIGRFTDHIPFVTPLIVNQLIKTAFVTFKNVWGTLGEIFTNNDTRGKVVSTAIGIPVSFTVEVNEMLIELNKRHGPFSGIFSYRYVKKSQALLAFTRFDHTCIVELDGVESEITRSFYELVWNELNERKIPHTFHWGKISNLDAAALQNMYEGSVNRWIKARNVLMHPDTLRIFNSELLQGWGLDTVIEEKKTLPDGIV